jgi:hypothetical protein
MLPSGSGGKGGRSGRQFSGVFSLGDLPQNGSIMEIADNPTETSQRQ